MWDLWRFCFLNIIIYFYRVYRPSQCRGGCGHMMAGFDPHSVCERCRDKKKGQDPRVEKQDSICAHCNALSPEQLAQHSTPSYKLKKEKWEAKSTSTKEPSSDTLSPTLVDPALVSVVGVVDGQSTSRSPGLSVPPEKKRKSDSKKASTSKVVKSDKAVKTTTSRPPASTSTNHDKSATDRPIPSTDSRISELDQKWSDWFNQLEALLMARTLNRPQDETFTTVKVTPTHASPANALRPEPFLKPTSQSSQLPDRPSTVDPQTLSLSTGLLLKPLLPSLLNWPANRPHRDSRLVPLIVLRETFLLQVILIQILSHPIDHH